MIHKAKSVRSFIGSINFQESSAFYRDLGFEEVLISPAMSYFSISAGLGFYLQNAYVKDWIDNTMIFLEVEDVEEYWKQLNDLHLPQKYTTVKLTPIRNEYWGRECFLHDPSGILWHFGQFKKQPENS